jgi:hypothetical protein
MPTTTPKIRRFTPAEIAIASDVLTHAVQHGQAEAPDVAMDLAAKWAAKVDAGCDLRAALMLIQNEAFAIWCDRLAAGYRAWIERGASDD